jgi:WD40 repeat protein
LKVLSIWPSQPFVQGGVAFTPDDRFLTAWNNKVGLLLLDIASHGKEKFEIPCSGQFAVTQDGRMLASCNGKDIMLWDLSGPAPVQRTVIQQHTDTVTRVLFAPSGQTLYSASNDGTVRIWAVHTAHSEEKAMMKAPWGKATVGFGPDCRVCMTHDASAADKSVRIWTIDPDRLEIKERVQSRKTPARPIQIAFPADGRRLAYTNQDDFTVYLWDLTGDESRVRNELKGHAGNITGLAFAPDGRTLISASPFDGKMIFWDVSSGRKLEERTHGTFAKHITYSVDGRHLAVYANDFRAAIVRLASFPTSPRP